MPFIFQLWISWVVDIYFHSIQLTAGVFLTSVYFTSLLTCIFAPFIQYRHISTGLPKDNSLGFHDFLSLMCFRTFLVHSSRAASIACTNKTWSDPDLLLKALPHYINIQTTIKTTSYISGRQKTYALLYKNTAQPLDYGCEVWHWISIKINKFLPDHHMISGHLFSLL